MKRPMVAARERGGWDGDGDGEGDDDDDGEGGGIGGRGRGGGNDVVDKICLSLKGWDMVIKIRMMRAEVLVIDMMMMMMMMMMMC